MSWSYQRKENSGYTTKIPEGKHRIRIRSAEKAQSKSSGNDMLVLQFDVSGYPDIVYYYIVFMNDHPEITNGKLTQFFDSFKDIEDGNFDMKSWIGKVGAATIKHDEYNGNVNAKISWFLKADKQGDLPQWKEPVRESKAQASGNVDADGFMVVPDTPSEKMPF